MIKSMTGFGRGEYSDEKRSVIAEIKSVNHRYCDISVRMPRRYSFAEEKIKNTVKQTVSRGKVEVSIIVDNIGADEININLNKELAKQYMENLVSLRDTFGMNDEITLEYIASLPDVLKVIPEIENEDEMSGILCRTVKAAAEKHDEMRKTEGEKLAEDILMRSGLIENMVKEIEVRSPEVVKAYTEKLKERIADLIGGSTVATEERILLEAAVFADKANVTEETVRLASHISQLRNIVKESAQPDGKKLDFLVQEMNREANTIGSKANDIEITNRVLDIKSEIEKIREQVQNLE
ncbi:MAG: YicC family protein [Firmicutes bacterium]|nr:YicC family protein [Bacillota bacterium]